MLMREKMEEQKQENRVSKNSVYSQNTRTLVLLSVIIVLGYFLLNGLDEIDQVIFKLMR
jgi:ABC-type protease/lipase transport system fused ATPase/permease subunit